MKTINKYLVVILFIFGFLLVGANLASAGTIAGDVTVTVTPAVPAVTPTGTLTANPYPSCTIKKDERSCTTALTIKINNPAAGAKTSVTGIGNGDIIVKDFIYTTPVTKTGIVVNYPDSIFYLNHIYDTVHNYATLNFDGTAVVNNNPKGLTVTANCIDGTAWNNGSKTCVSTTPPQVMSGTLTGEGCTITTGTTCKTTLSLKVTNPVKTFSTVTTGYPSFNSTVYNVDLTTSGKQYVTTPYSIPEGDTTFYLYNNEVLLGQVTLKGTKTNTLGTCSDGIKNQTETGIDTGGICASGTLTVSSASCIIDLNKNNCSITGVTWTTTKATNPALIENKYGPGPADLSSSTFSTLANQTTPLKFSVTFPATTFDLKDGTKLLASKNATASCGANVWDPGTLTCKTTTIPLSISVSPATYSVTLPSSTISAIYTLTNGTSTNTTCRLLDNLGNAIPPATYTPCISPMSVTAPNTPSGGIYAYSIQAFKSQTNETKTSNQFKVTVNPVAGCTNGANNYPDCNSNCSSPQEKSVTVDCPLKDGITASSGTVTNNYKMSPFPVCTFELVDSTKSCVYPPATGTWSYPACPEDCGLEQSPQIPICTGGPCYSTTKPDNKTCPETRACNPGEALDITFTATPSTIWKGSGSTLTWTSTADECHSADSNFNTSTHASDSITVSPTETTTYTIQCTKKEGNKFDYKTKIINVKSVTTKEI